MTGNNLIAGCPVQEDLYRFIEGAAAANGMNVATFTAWSMTRWAEAAIDKLRLKEKRNDV